MTKEELIGRKFKTSNGEGETYILIDHPNPSLIYLNGINDNDDTKVSWKVSTVSSYINDGTDSAWKLLPKENKMYKTPKGIEYGVGTQFKNEGSGNTYTIDKIENGRVYISGAAITPQDWLINIFNISIADNHCFHKVIPMKDYKQVDPKTIKFDFTNTKIKVNNEEESKWVQEVAFNNKYDWYSDFGRVRNTQVNYLYFGTFTKGRIEWAESEDYFISCKSKEITIQDILNNMKEVIEVGDVVELLDTQSSQLKVKTLYTVDKIDSDGSIRIKGTGSHSNVLWSFDVDKVKLVSKGRKKEIIGYETVVDLPGIPKGSKSTNVVALNAQWMFGVEKNIVYYNNEQVSDTKFFKPIYKQDAIELKFSKYTATLSKENGLVFSFDNEVLLYSDIKHLLHALADNNHTLPKSYNTFSVVVNYDIKNVKVGCKSFTKNDVKVLEDAIKKLDE